MDQCSRQIFTAKCFQARNLMRKLIISSGDTGDVDGFFALAEYSKVIFFFASSCWNEQVIEFVSDWSRRVVHDELPPLRWRDSI